MMSIARLAVTASDASLFGGCLRCSRRAPVQAEHHHFRSKRSLRVRVAHDSSRVDQIRSPFFAHRSLVSVEAVRVRKVRTANAVDDKDWRQHLGRAGGHTRLADSSRRQCIDRRLHAKHATIQRVVRRCAAPVVTGRRQRQPDRRGHGSALGFDDDFTVGANW